MSSVLRVRSVRGSAWLFFAFCGTVFVGLVLLGNWQVTRLQWKLDLIKAAETRAYQSPSALPAGYLNEENHLYLRVMAEGIYQHDLERRIKAVTGLGPGYWVMTPLLMKESHIWVNRGFIPQGSFTPSLVYPEGLQKIEGLLRFSEPDGTALEKNDPLQGRWYSPDIPALNLDVGLVGEGNFYIDAIHQLPQGAWPRGGMTKLAFRNHHLIYAVTWYTMATMLAAVMVYLIRRYFRSLRN